MANAQKTASITDLTRWYRAILYPHAPSRFRSQSTAQDRLEDLELAAIVGTAVILLGIFFEIIAELLRHSDRAHLILSMIGNGLIGIGLIHELQATRVTIIDTREDNAESERKVAEANKAAEQANERAAILEKEAADARERTARIELQTARRKISAEQRASIVSRLHDLLAGSSASIIVESEQNDTEAFLFASDIAKIFEDTGFHKKVRWGSNHWGTGYLFGLHIAGRAATLIRDPTVPSQFDVSPIIAAFVDNEINVTEGRVGIPGTVPATTPYPILYVFVATKLPPELVQFG